MKEILYRATLTAERRGSPAIAMEDLVFLMRSSPIKVQRLLKYLAVKDMAASVAGDRADGIVATKRVRRCKDFLFRIDTNGMLVKVCDVTD